MGQIEELRDLILYQIARNLNTEYLTPKTLIALFILKYGFLRSYFFKNEPLISCPFLSSKLDSPVIKTLEKLLFKTR